MSDADDIDRETHEHALRKNGGIVRRMLGDGMGAFKREMIDPHLKNMAPDKRNALEIIFEKLRTEVKRNFKPVDRATMLERLKQPMGERKPLPTGHENIDLAPFIEEVAKAGLLPNDKAEGILKNVAMMAAVKAEIEGFNRK